MQRWRPNHPHLTAQKLFCFEISQARDRTELVTDDAKALREQLEAVTVERISALKGHYAVSVSGNWRVQFRFEDGVAIDVDHVDYH